MARHRRPYGLEVLVCSTAARSSGTRGLTWCRPCAEPLEERRLLTTFPVTNLDDFGPGSLRQAIIDANNNGGADTVDLTGVSGTIDVGLGEMEITEALTIEGPGDDLLAINAQGNSRIFNITTTVGDITFSGLLLTGGQTTGSGASASDPTYSGGAIRSLSAGTLTIQSSMLANNETTGDRAPGGAVATSGDLILIDSFVTDNTTMGVNSWGGALFTRDEGDVTLTRTVVGENSTEGDTSNGGGIRAAGHVTLIDSIVGSNSTIGSSSLGGGIWSGRSVTLYNSTVTENTTTGSFSGGGGINALREVILHESTVSGNSTQGSLSPGGGIRTTDDVTLYQSTVSANSTADIFSRGGGIYSRSDANIHNSTVSGNGTTGDDSPGGGIYAFDDVTLSQSTVSGNYTQGDESHGGGVYASGDLSISHSTITENDAGALTASGGGIHAYDDPVNVDNSIVAANSAGGGMPDIEPGTGTFNVDYSLIGVDPGGIVGANNIFAAPMLAPLALVGGPTQTHEPLPGSPVIDAGDPAIVPVPGEFDQRGAPFTPCRRWRRRSADRYRLGRVARSTRFDRRRHSGRRNRR